MWIEQLPSGKFKYFERYKHPYTNKLKKVSVTLTNKSRQTQKEAQIILNNKIADAINSSKQDNTMTFKELYDRWYKDYKPHVVESTYLQTALIMPQVIDLIGEDTLISKIDPLLLNDVFDNLLYKKNLSNKYTAGLKSKINLIFKYAIKKGYLEDNPIRKVDVTYRPRFEKTKLKDKFLEDDEYKKLVDYLEQRNQRYAILCQWLYLTGMRAGEALALQKDDVYVIDDEYRVSITGTLMTRGRSVSEFKKSDRTKTPAGIRDIKLPKKAIALYKRLLKLNPTGSFLFQTKRGTPTQIQPINSYLKIHKEKMGFSEDKPLSTHIFRHTHISKLAELGVPLPVIQDRVGHEDSKITEQIYLHITKKMKQDMESEIDKL